MRIWSIHPKYLDSKGLLALWRETLLAKHVLKGQTKGYKNHPQLNRFKDQPKPIDSINAYLAEVYNEAVRRGYNFNRDKIDWDFSAEKINVNSEQVKYEFQHLLNKLKIRDPIRFNDLFHLKEFETHPLFSVIQGEIEDWEVLK